jgi:DNA-binding response OmpR family regulator
LEDQYSQSMKHFCILVVDDEQRILKFLNLKFKNSGYEVLTAQNGLKALEQVQSNEPDLIVLDIMMPGMDGFETLKQIRAFSSVPVIMLSAREDNVDKVKGLELGADDYLAKPFNPDELVARIEAIRRRLAPDQDRKLIEFIRFGNVSINFMKHLVSVNGKETQLTRIEWLLLSELSRNAGKLMMYEQLLTRIWGPEYRNDLQILRTWISRLRNKIDQGSNQSPIIRTIPKTGYIFEPPKV